MEELRALGARSIEATEGGVSFMGEFSLCYHANLESRIATRILWRVGHGRYQNEDQLYQAAYALPWGDWFEVGRTFLVKVTAVRCPLKSLEFITLRIKDAVCDKFRALVGSRPSVDTRQPDARIHLFLSGDQYQLYLDTSGNALYQRGLRRASVEAPLRENLAAGILRLTDWKPGVALLDPMCGSGTFLLEAAMMALDIAPGSGRSFGFEKLNHYDAALWRTLREAAKARVKPLDFMQIYGSDVDLRAVRVTKRNLEQADLLQAVWLTQQEFTQRDAPAERGVLIANPPYGARIGEQEQLAALYPQLGAALKQKYAGWSAYFLTSDMRLPKLMRLAPSKRTPLYNGALECRLFEFRMVAGSNRKL